MKQNSYVRDMVLSGLFIALGIVLPMAFHSVKGGGPIFLLIGRTFGNAAVCNWNRGFNSAFIKSFYFNASNISNASDNDGGIGGLRIHMLSCACTI